MPWSKWEQKDYGNNTDNYNNRPIIMNHVTLKTGVMAAENPAMHHWNKLILRYSKIEKVILNRYTILRFYCILA